MGGNIGLCCYCSKWKINQLDNLYNEAILYCKDVAYGENIHPFYKTFIYLSCIIPGYYSSSNINHHSFLHCNDRLLAEDQDTAGKPDENANASVIPAADSQQSTTSSLHPPPKRSHAAKFCMLTKFMLPLVITQMVPDVAEQVCVIVGSWLPWMSEMFCHCDMVEILVSVYLV